MMINLSIFSQLRNRTQKLDYIGNDQTHYKNHNKQCWKCPNHFIETDFISTALQKKHRLIQLITTSAERITTSFIHEVHFSRKGSYPIQKKESHETKEQCWCKDFVVEFHILLLITIRKHYRSFSPSFSVLIVTETILDQAQIQMISPKNEGNYECTYTRVRIKNKYTQYLI